MGTWEVGRVTYPEIRPNRLVYSYGVVVPCKALEESPAMSRKKSCKSSWILTGMKDISGSLIVSVEGLDQLKILASIFECSPIAHCIGLGKRFSYPNPAFESLTGYSKSELLSLALSDVLSSLFPEHNALEPAGASPTRVEAPFEVQMITKEGSRRWVSATVTPIEDLHRDAVLLTLADITERKKREDVLSRNELRYRAVLAFAPDMVIIYSIDGTIIDISPIGAKILGISREEAIGRNGPKEFWSEEDRTRFSEILEETLKHGEWIGEIKGFHADGRPFFTESNAKVAELGSETVIIVISRDITQRKLLEEQLLLALREKEMLLREIHHRVKNNMQIISSLLRLQVRNSNDQNTRALFRESQNRILSMAMIHEKLYQSEGIHRIAFREYANDLVHEVLNSFGKDANTLSVTVEIDDCILGIDTAIPCGLIIIELFSNALKYAFPDGRRGEVSISLHRDGRGGFLLTVCDNGIGIPEHLEIECLRSLGLKLVWDLARYQLQGEVRIKKDKGTSVYVAFSETKGCSTRDSRQ